MDQTLSKVENDLCITFDEGVKKMLTHFGYSSPEAITKVTEENVTNDLQNFLQDLRTRDKPYYPPRLEEKLIIEPLGLAYGTRKQLFSGQKRQIQLLATYTGRGEEHSQSNTPATPSEAGIYKEDRFDANIKELLKYFGYTSSKVLEHITENDVEEDLQLFIQDIKAYQGSSDFKVHCQNPLKVNKSILKQYNIAHYLGLTTRAELFSGQKCQLKAIVTRYEAKQKQHVIPGVAEVNNTDEEENSATT